MRFIPAGHGNFNCRVHGKQVHSALRKEVISILCTAQNLQKNWSCWRKKLDTIDRKDSKGCLYAHDLKKARDDVKRKTHKSKGKVKCDDDTSSFRGWSLVSVGIGGKIRGMYHQVGLIHWHTLMKDAALGSTLSAPAYRNDGRIDTAFES